ncbi:MAG: PepSY domain-containing protein [Ilumatobacteraceae bacterium]
MISRLRKASYTVIAGAGLFAGAVGIASAASNSSTTAPPPVTAPATPSASTPSTNGTTVDAPEANDTADAPGTPEANDNAGEQSPAYTASVTAPQDQGANEAGEAKALAGLAKVTPDQASAAATAAVPGTVNKVELQNENGNVVYGVEIATSTGTADVKIDAGNASVLAKDTGDAGEHNGANESDNGAEDAPAAPGTVTAGVNTVG